VERSVYGGGFWVENPKKTPKKRKKTPATKKPKKKI
jgi:hypothetical protein